MQILLFTSIIGEEYSSGNSPTETNYQKNMEVLAPICYDRLCSEASGFDL